MSESNEERITELDQQVTGGPTQPQTDEERKRQAYLRTKQADDHAFQDAVNQAHYPSARPLAFDATSTDQEREFLLQFFSYDHLPEHLARVSAPFSAVAHTVIMRLPRNQERTVALRKLLESKDCAVRAALAR